jgi:hypothetical protein
LKKITFDRSIKKYKKYSRMNIQQQLDKELILATKRPDDDIYIIKILLIYGVNIDHGDNNSPTAVWSALLHRNFKQVELLIDYGADIHITYNGQSLVDYVKFHKKQKSVYKANFSRIQKKF